MESHQSILRTVGELIDESLSEQGTRVNFKLIQTILHILAKQLRILQRRVRVESNYGAQESTTSITVRELKLVTKVPKTSKDAQSIKSTKALRLSTKLAGNEEHIDPDTLEILECIEEQREKELRIIHQRIDSYEEPEPEPLPMKSMSSLEKIIQNEKILVVERVPSTQAKITKSAPQMRARNERLSIVTQEEFEALQNEVKELAMIFHGIPAGTNVKHIDSAQLILKLKKSTNLSDAMVALQLAARMDAAEETIRKLSGILTDVVKSIPREGAITKDFKIESTAYDFKKDIDTRSITSVKTQEHLLYSSRVSRINSEHQPTEETASHRPEYVTDEQLRETLQKIRDEYTKKCDQLSKQITDSIENAKTLINKYDSRITEDLDFKTRLLEAEATITAFGDCVTRLDTQFSCRLTDFQERLTQLQFDLELGIEKMVEALANRSGDPVAVAELNQKLTMLQSEFDFINNNQNELDRLQMDLSTELEALQGKLHLINEVKCDREEVVDSLKDKVGIGALNGLVKLEEFKCIQNYLESKIQESYNRFNCQEFIWQKAIEDIYVDLNHKVNKTVINDLQVKIDDELKQLKAQYQALCDIVGEPHAAITSRVLFRDTTCASCSTPANMKPYDEEQMEKLRSLPRQRPPTIGAEAKAHTCPKADGDHEKCYFGQPMPKGHLCRRYCGGSHTRLDKIAVESIVITKQPATKQKEENKKGPCKCATEID